MGIENTRRAIGFSLFFSAFLLYLSSVCPNMYWRDAAEFQAVAFQLGIAHPAGSPFYALIAKLFTFLPFGSIAFKVNLVSAFFGALLILLTFLLITECLEYIFSSTSNALFAVSAAIAVAFYIVSNSLWHNSIVAEVYTLQNCCIVLIAIFLLRSLTRKEAAHRYLYLSALFFGLSTGAHIIMILYIPALILFLLLFHRKSITLAHLGVIVMFVTLGASIYLYLPVRSVTNPYYDWGNPETAENFITHVTDRKDSQRHFFFSPELFLRKLKKYGTYYREDFSILGIALGLLGMVVFIRKKPRFFIGLGALFFSQWFFFIRYWPWSSAFIATFLFFTLGIGVGVFWLIHKCQGSLRFPYKFVSPLLVTLCLIQVLLLGFPHWKKNNHAGYWSPFVFYRYLYDQIAFHGALVNSICYFGTSYLQQCENYRLDVTNLFLSEIFSPRLFNTVTPERYPLLAVPQSEAAGIGEALINANIAKHPFYWDPTSKTNYVVKDNLQPAGLLFRLSPVPSPVSAEATDRHIRIIKDFFEKYTTAYHHYNDPEENLLYSIILENISRFFYDRRDHSLTIAHLLVAERLTPNNPNILNGLASSYATLGRYTEAESYLKKALSKDPAHITSLQNLAQVYVDTERHFSAFPYYQKILQFEPENAKAHYNLGTFYERTEETEKAKAAFREVIAINPESELAGSAKEKLAALNHQ